jgi:hypothetical protein
VGGNRHLDICVGLDKYATSNSGQKEYLNFYPKISTPSDP